MEWLAENAGTILVTIALAGVVAMIIRRMIKNKKQGKSSCGCGCENCSAGGSCHHR